MRKLKMRMVFLPAIALAAVQVLQAQDDCGDECRINSNVAMVINVQVNASAQAVGAGWGIAGGIGYNFDRRNALIGEFMWNRVYPSGGALKPFETALQSTDLRGNTDLYTLTGEYRFEMRGQFTRSLSYRWRRVVFPQYLALEGGSVGHWHRLLPRLALVGISLYLRNRKSRRAASYL